MCYYNGIRVSRAEFIRLKTLEKQIKQLQRVKDYLNRDLINGFDFGNTVILKATPDKKDFDVVEAHWELLPDWVKSSDDFKEFREGKKDPVTGKPLINQRTGKPLTGYTTLDAKGETLLTSPMYKDAARNGRCLILSSGFYEWKHIKKITYPHFITLKEEYMVDGEYFYIAGVCKEWTDKKTGETFDTCSMSTSPANEFMAEIHNQKKRMPAILPPDEAFEWLFGDLSDQRITELATYQIPSDWMKAHTIAKDFRTALNPTERYEYAELQNLFS